MHCSYQLETSAVASGGNILTATTVSPAVEPTVIGTKDVPAAQAIPASQADLQELVEYEFLLCSA